MTSAVKPIGRKAYGSIGHLPGSRMGPADHHVHPGQAAICTAKLRDRRDLVIVQEKLDGSCVAVVRLGDELHAIGRAGWPAQSSRHEMHQLFAAWVRERSDRFLGVLRDGERIVGEWLAQAHGTIYDLSEHEPFAAFDIMAGERRIPYSEFHARVPGHFATPTLLHHGGALSVADAMRRHRAEGGHWPCDEVEGVVYRVERDGEVEFLAKYVRHDKIDGKYLDGPQIWNWRPSGSAVGLDGEG